MAYRSQSSYVAPYSRFSLYRFMLSLDTLDSDLHSCGLEIKVFEKQETAKLGGNYPFSFLETITPVTTSFSLKRTRIKECSIYH